MYAFATFDKNGQEHSVYLGYNKAQWLSLSDGVKAAEILYVSEHFEVDLDEVFVTFERDYK